MAHESIFPTFHPASEELDARVYVELSRLTALQYKAKGFSFLPRQPVHSILNGRYASRVRGRGLNFEEIRQYRPGDDVRSIDWKVTARMRQAHSRVFTEERDRPVLFLVDQRIEMFFGTKLLMKSVVAAEAAALGAWRVLSTGDRVGGLVFDDRQIDEIRPGRSRQTVMQLLKSITRFNQAMRADAGIEANPGMLNRALKSALRLAGHDFLVVIISDFMGADDDTEKLLKQLTAHNDVLGVLVHDPSATNLPGSDDLVATDGRLQARLSLGEERTRRDVESFTSGRISTLLGYRETIGVPMLPLSTGEEVAHQVQRLLGFRRG
ncbi:MAG: DUF58 domain-containing protein [Pseudomonadota bacterium]